MSSNGTPRNRSTEQVVLREMERVFAPLERAVYGGPPGVFRLLVATDVDASAFVEEDLRAVTDALATASEAYSRLSTAVVDEGPPDVEEVPALVEDAKEVVETVRSLDEQVDLRADVDAGAVGEQLLDYLLVQYLERHHPRVNALLVLGNVVVRESEQDVGRVEFSNLVGLLEDPKRIPAAAVGWGTDDFEAFLVVYYLKEVCASAGLPARLEAPFSGVQAAMATGEPLREDGSHPRELFTESLSLPVVVFEEGVAGLQVVPLPGAVDALPGLAVVPYGPLPERASEDLGSGWTFNVDVSESRTDWGLAIRPDPETSEPTPELTSLDGSDDPGPDLHGEAELSRAPSSSGSEETVVLGTQDGTRVSVGSVGATASVDVTGEEVTLEIAFPATGTLEVDSTDVDGFLSEVLPDEGLVHQFDVTVGWSSSDGLFFERSGGLEVSLPRQTRVGAVRLTELYLGVVPRTDADEVRMEGTASAAVELGPVTGTITRMGVSADVGFPEDGDGNLGPLDLAVGFEPPDGIGLSVDSGVVTGGGFLRFDPDEERYSGVVQLRAGDVAVDAVGLLTTRLPDGGEGFSLLVLVAGEFTPIRLGLGFTLNGVGGLLGVNRSVKSGALGDAVRQGSLDSVLFPDDPVANAQRVVSDLRGVFPPKRDRHVFGPMARVGWGTPTLLTADLGVVVRFPSSDFLVLGRVSAALPAEGERTLVDLNVGVAGVVAPSEKRAAFDASLYDSRVGRWTVTGDAALRSRWGTNPWFLLSVGGFNPRFEPPTDVPDLDRVTVAGGLPSGTPSIDVSGYFALTSNTAQTGADVRLRAEAGPASVEGHIGFDALFRFDPFEFVVDFAASVAVEVHGKGLSVTLDGVLSGPAPWRVTGTIHVDLFLFDVTATVDVSFGAEEDREPLPSTEVMPKLLAAFENPENWMARSPAEGESAVSLRDVDADGRVLAHPRGRLGVRQSVVPLDFELERVGNTRPGDFTRFTIEDIAVTGAGDDPLDFERTVREHFAPAQYEELANAEKLARPAFVRLKAGREVTTDGLFYGAETDEALAANARTTTLTYETSVVDERRGARGEALSELGSFESGSAEATVSIPPATADALAEVSAVARADTRTTGVERFRQRDGAPERVGADRSMAPDGNVLTRAVSMDEANYAVVRAADLAPTDVGAADGRPAVTSRAEARQALDRHLAAHPEDEGDLGVAEAGAVRARGQVESDDDPDQVPNAGGLGL